MKSSRKQFYISELPDEERLKASAWSLGSTFVTMAIIVTQELVVYLDAAYNLARWLMRDETDAEDVVQDAYVRAIRHYAGLRGGDGRAWFLAIVRNRCYDRLRQRGAEDAHADFDEAIHSLQVQAPNPETALLRAERGELVRRALSEMPAEYREVLVLRELEQLSYGEIAEVTGIPIGTVMSRLNRARKRLQQILTGWRVISGLRF